ncbi:MAG: hypothetical protein ACK4OM_02745 [Alphaproteobacteria bacterium]
MYILTSIILSLFIIYLLWRRLKSKTLIKNQLALTDEENKIVFTKLNIENKILIKGVIFPIGQWTNYVWRQKLDLIKSQVINYDSKLGYFQNLIIAQKFAAKNFKNNSFFDRQ